MFENVVQDLRVIRGKTDILLLANSNNILIHHLSIGYNHEILQVLASKTQEQKSSITLDLLKIPISSDVPKIHTKKK